MSLISRFISIQWHNAQINAVMLQIAGPQSVQQQNSKYHRIICAQNDKYKTDRDGYRAAGNVAGGRRIYQVVERPVWYSTAAQQVRQFGWRASNCRKSENNLSHRVRQFGTEIKATKRKMVNGIFIPPPSYYADKI